MQKTSELYKASLLPLTVLPLIHSLLCALPSKLDLAFQIYTRHQYFPDFHYSFVSCFVMGLRFVLVGWILL